MSIPSCLLSALLQASMVDGRLQLKRTLTFFGCFRSVLTKSSKKIVISGLGCPHTQ